MVFLLFRWLVAACAGCSAAGCCDGFFGWSLLVLAALLLAAVLAAAVLAAAVLASAGCCAGYCWLLASGCCWLLASRCRWLLLLAAAGCRWLLLAAAGHCWLLLDAAGHLQLLLDAHACECRSLPLTLLADFCSQLAAMPHRCAL